MQTKKKISDLLSFILNKAKCGNVATNKESSDIDTKDPKSQTNTQHKKIIPKSPKITKPKPRVFKEPEAIDNKFVAKKPPLETFKKTSLKTIEENRQKRLLSCKKQTEEKYAKERQFDLQTEKIKIHYNDIKKELEDKEKSELQFNNKYCNPLKDFSKDKADVKYNEAAILREEHLIKKKEDEEKKELEKILIEKKDTKEYERWISEMKLKDNIEKMEKIQKRKIELEMNREVATNYLQQRIKQNHLKAAQHKKAELINIKKRQKEKQKEIKQKQQLVKEINMEKDNIKAKKTKLIEDNQNLYKQRLAEYNELNLISKEESKIEQQRRNDLIRQIRELERIPIQRTKGFDPTETPGYGLFEEMSLVELRERLELQKKMLKDQIEAKREENKMKMEERTDSLINKANVIAEHRDKLRNIKEVERKKKKDAIKAKEEMVRKIREKSLIEVKAKIDAKKEKLKKEDEIFQKKIREIKLQRQFLQLGRAAVEEKAYKQMEDGLERKINDRQNKDLVDQQKVEAVNVYILLYNF